MVTSACHRSSRCIGRLRVSGMTVGKASNSFFYFLVTTIKGCIMLLVSSCLWRLLLFLILFTCNGCARRVCGVHSCNFGGLACLLTVWAKRAWAYLLRWYRNHSLGFVYWRLICHGVVTLLAFACSAFIFVFPPTLLRACSGRVTLRIYSWAIKVRWKQGLLLLSPLLNLCRNTSVLSWRELVEYSSELVRLINIAE